MYRIAVTLLMIFAISELGFTQEILFESRIDTNFSSLEFEDTFELVLIGDSLLNSTGYFRILSSNGDTLLHESHPHTAFYSSYRFEENDYEGIRNEILGQLSNFFNPAKFSRPIITDEKTFWEDNSKPDIWNEFKSDTSSIGFQISLYEEYVRELGFSQLKNKVVVIWACC